MDPADYKILFDKAYTRALKFLSFRPRSEREISDFLIKKKFDPLIIEKVIELLKEQKLVSDHDFAKWWIVQRQEQRPKGKILIKQELKQKGISTEIIEKELEDAQEDYKTAQALMKKKQRTFASYKDEDYKKKVAAFLQRRGFTWDVVKKIITEEKDFE